MFGSKQQNYFVFFTLLTLVLLKIVGIQSAQAAEKPVDGVNGRSSVSERPSSDALESSTERHRTEAVSSRESARKVNGATTPSTSSKSARQSTAGAAESSIATDEKQTAFPSSEASENPALLPNRYVVTSPNNDSFVIRVRNTWENSQHASVFINRQEVVRFRSPLNGLSPLNRAKVLAHRLALYIQQGHDPAAIRVFPEGPKATQAVVNGATASGEPVRLLLLDAKTATEAGTTPQKLGFVWVNHIRQAFGVLPLEGAQVVAPSQKPSSSTGKNVDDSQSTPSDAAKRSEAQPQAGTLSASKPAQGLLDPGSYRVTGRRQVGMASWYGPGFHGRRTASGRRFDMHGLTAAHRTLPFGTKVKVTNQRTGRSCVVEITDRGPYSGHRILDLSRGAASAIGLLGSGVAKITMEVIKPR
ncbi:MAG: septal ring lytic transglycosylase RlpA family protein [Candidatus Melainabacteria bacterium]|nr:septal ring lytic transglycosylase RlpA family protein [Candidatus Melainabacteria bacterium]